ncbi:MAG: glycine--tRNA ligase subunit beta [Neisseriaceae bacterium]|nr:glycine--tRNA ligase subunit beta [Neisseriaceae bacterium]
MNSLLIELLTEELPPKALKNLGEHFACSVAQGLFDARLIDNATQYTAFATPRRLAVLLPNVADIQPDMQMLKKGPSVANAMKDGEPTKALQGFMRSCGAELSALKIINDGKQDVYAFEWVQHGKSLAELLGEILQTAVKKLPIPKVMRWGSSTHSFVRPVHKLLVLHGNQTVPVSLLGLESGNSTIGHRFLSAGDIVIDNADNYEQILFNQGKVIASFATRKVNIQAALNQLAAQYQACVAADNGLLEEVTALVEYPVVLQGEFEQHFLSVPQECLILTMQQNQKYFPLLDANGKLTHRFLMVSNMQAENPEHIIKGNERVLRARLSDAQFFFEQDKKRTLESRLPKLTHVVYHNQLGTQAERIVRLIDIAVYIAGQMNADVAQTLRAAELCKADLVCEMVGEFPELQGIMGHYYALNDGLDNTVALAIEEHYLPRFAGDRLPESPVGVSVALADKLETLVGIWGIGLKPTGDKDPYGLRRNALGILRMAMQHNLSLSSLVQIAFDTFEKGKLADSTVSEVLEFMDARLAIMLQNDYAHDEVAAVLAVKTGNLGDIPARLSAVSHFKKLAEAQALSAANKRVSNILKKNAVSLNEIQIEDTLLVEPAEKDLYAAVSTIAQQVQPSLANKDFQAALTALAQLKTPIDAFFDSVMVMADNPQIRHNRLNLLAFIQQQTNAVADIGVLDC